MADGPKWKHFTLTLAAALDTMIQVTKLQINFREVINMKKAYMTILYQNISGVMLVAGSGLL